MLEVTKMKQEQEQVRILGIAPYEGMQATMERAAENHPDIHLDVYIGDLEGGRRHRPGASGGGL